jgi:hypothetical protein
VQIIGFVEWAEVHAEQRNDISSRWSTNETKVDESFNGMILLGETTIDYIHELK